MEEGKKKKTDTYSFVQKKHRKSKTEANVFGHLQGRWK
jgi:hypothetical protein